MQQKKVWAVYFSPTGTTETIIKTIAMRIDTKAVCIDFTLPDQRKNELEFSANDLVIIGVPVYAGRVPNVLLPFLNTICGNGALAVPIVVYGNRNYDDALIELKNILEQDGFNPIAAAAFIGEHSFSKLLAADRPDTDDLIRAIDFADRISLTNLEPISVAGQQPIREYYRPRDRKGNFIDIRKVKPKTGESCINCKICVRVCPMGAIDEDRLDQVPGVCIKCGACIKKCPEGAKYYDDEGYLYHKHELEEMFTRRAEPEFFLNDDDKV